MAAHNLEISSTLIVFGVRRICSIWSASSEATRTLSGGGSITPVTGDAGASVARMASRVRTGFS